MADSIWNKIASWATRESAHYLYVPIPKDRTDSDHDEAPLATYASYFRLWLKEMQLSRSRQWFRDWYPAVHSAVRLKFGDVEGVDFSHVARAPQQALAKSVLLNYSVTELLPWNGGVVEIEAALLALKGPSHLAAAIDVLQGFSDLVAPPLGQVLKVAEKVSTGMNQLFEATEGDIHLGFHQGLMAGGAGAANVLRPGYHAVILATASRIARDRLSVRGDQLWYAEKPDGPAAPLDGHDYMLFFVEGRKERDDWRLKNIQEPLDNAIEATLLGKTEEADAFEKAALVAAYRSSDLAVYDRRRVVEAIRDELREVRGMGLGAVGGGKRDLNEVMRARAMNLSHAAALGELSLEEALLGSK